MPKTTIQHTQSAGGVVVGPEGKIVLVNQRHNSWSLPKGHVEEGEEIEETARREIYEETGIKDLILVRPLGSYERYRLGPPEPDGCTSGETKELKKIFLFLYTTSQSVLRPIDPHNPEAIWLSAEDIASRLTHPADAAYFATLLKNGLLSV